MKVERQTYAGWKVIRLPEYELVHGIIESFGGRVKDFQQLKDEKWIMFFEMGKANRAEFEKEIYQL